MRQKADEGEFLKFKLDAFRAKKPDRLPHPACMNVKEKVMH